MIVLPDWLNIFLRSVALFFLLFFLIKLLGKKHLSQLSLFDYINGVVLGGIVAIVVAHQDVNFWHGVIALSVWFIFPFTIDYIALKSKKVRNFVHGKSTVIIQDGKIMEDNLKKESVSTDDLLEQLREKNIFRVADVEFALLEPTGKINVLPKTENQPLTAKALNIKLAPEKEPQTVIMDGKMQLEPLANLNLNPAWLETELAKLNVTIENVFLAQADNDGQLTVDLYDDKLSIPSPTEKPLLLATLKKTQADLELYALETENEHSKQLYKTNAKRLGEAIHLVEPYLK